MIDKLEEIKKIRNYDVHLMFGENIGCDDCDVPTEERSIKIFFAPVGYLGELRVMWKGTYKEFLSFDFKTTPTKASNPPTDLEIMKPGYYIWGTDRSIERFFSKREIKDYIIRSKIC